MSSEFDGSNFEEQWDRLANSGEVPRSFFSEYLSAPFVRCIDCDADLLATDEIYSVIKAYVAGETVFEMAICSRCTIRLGQGYSQQSRAAFEAAMREWQQRRQPDDSEARAVDSDTATDVEDSFPLMVGKMDQLARCAACDRPVEECHRYSIVGTFLGRSLVTPTEAPFRLPLMLCDRCNSATSENISQQTRDNWNRFVESNFDGPPGIELDSPQFDPILI